MKTALTFVAKNRAWIGWILLAISFLLGLLTLYWGEFVDEADNLVVGSLLLQGQVLYRDVFSHHFPFAYYWMAGVVALAGKTIFAARFSVLLFQVASFALLMRLTRKHLLLGLTALMWGIARPFYLGHMMIYPSFDGISLFVVFVLTLYTLQETLPPTWLHWLTIGAYSLIAFLSNPLSAYAIGITLIFLFIRKPAWELKAGTVIGVGLALYFGALALSDSLQAFWQDVVIFNSQVYNKYTGVQPIRTLNFFSYALTGLGLPYIHWFDFDLFKPIQIGYAQIDAWFFTGFLYRLGIIGASVLMIAQNKKTDVVASRRPERSVTKSKDGGGATPSSDMRLLPFGYAQDKRREGRPPRNDVLPGMYLYLFAAATLLIAKAHYRSQAFILVAMIALSMFALGEVRWDSVKPAMASAGRTLRVIVLAMTLWLGVRLVGQMIHDRADLTYDANFQKYEREANRLERLACDLPDVRLAYYPEGVYAYWFSGLQPASKYLFLWPWVAEVGQEEMIRELAEQEYVIVIVTDETVWDAYPTSDYLRPLLDYLDANYQKVGKETYLSPALFQACPP
ncbi:MAG: hypothetical protein AB1750_09420 [Chloroflexota bacterium]